MERYTLREGGRVLCPTERLEAALERLAAFEDLACGLEEEQQSISQRLEELRGRKGPSSSGNCWPKSWSTAA